MPRHLNDRQDYFGQTVNIVSRVQGLADRNVIVTTEAVVGDALISLILHDSGIISASRMAEFQGIGSEFRFFALS